MTRTFIRPDQLDPNGSYSFAQLVIDGYSGGCLNDGYVTGMVFTNGPGGPTTLEIDAADGGINQIGNGLVTFNGCVVLNGGVCSDITPCCNDAYDIGDPTHYFNDGYITNLKSTNVEATTVTATTVNATDATVSNNLTVQGDTTLGTGPEDCIIFNGVICSDIIPCCDDAYDIGDPTHRFNDGYFTNLTVNNFTVDNDITVTGDLTVEGNTILGNSPTDCVIFNASICSDIVPCCNDAYDIGDPTHYFNDGYITNLKSTSVEATTVTATTGNITTVNATDVNATGTVTTENLVANGDTTLGTGPEDCIIFNGVICSDIVPCCNDAYDIGDPTHYFNDGYITNLKSTNVEATTVTATTGNITTVNATDVAVSNNLTVNGDTTLGTGPEDCIIFNGVICSDIIPCCDDAYDIGDPTHRFNDGYFTNLTVNNFTVDNDITVTGNLTVQGDTILGTGPEDCIIFDGYICSDIIPCCDDSYQIGEPGKTWIDAYFYMPTFTNITPVGNIDSLIGVLKGIDQALADATIVFPRGVYVIVSGEASIDELISTRTVDQGVAVDVGAFTDAQFRDQVYIYLNGVLLYNDPTCAVDQAAVQNDIARKCGNLSTLIFKGNIKPCDIIQIVDMT